MELLRLRGFRVLFAAEIQSIAGDQLARVGLSILVFERTRSAAAAALTYATTFLPAILGGVLLSGLGDRYSRRAVLIACDLVRVSAFTAIATPDLPLPAIAALLVVAVFVGPAHTAAQVSYLADALGPDQFRAATGFRLTANQVAQVAGFALGGGLVAAIGPRGAVLIDAATFLFAAVIIARWLPARPVRPTQPAQPARSSAAAVAAVPPGRPSTSPASLPADSVPPAADPTFLRTAIGLCWLQGFFVVPEGLAVPFGAASGASTTQIGLLFASLPLGGALGAVLIVHTVHPHLRRRFGRAMAVLTGLPLVLTAVDLPVLVVFGMWAASGALAAYQVELMSEIVQGTRVGARARLIGRVGAGLVSAQGVGIVLFGLLAQWIGARPAVAWAGASGAAIAAALVGAEVAVTRSNRARHQVLVEIGCAALRRRRMPGQDR